MCENVVHEHGQPALCEHKDDVCDGGEEEGSKLHEYTCVLQQPPCWAAPGCLPAGHRGEACAGYMWQRNAGSLPSALPAAQIPRKVSHAYLAAGNRAEMLVK